MKIAAFILSAALQLGAAAAGFLFLLLALNGYSESQATPSLIFYIAAGIVSAVALGFASAAIANRLVQKRSFSKPGATALTVVGFAIIGWFVLVLVSIGAVVLAEVVRGMR
jgi:hypothetical protein